MTAYIITPLIGGLIGYITNDIAIRMLFRPHHAKYIGRFRVPFTPGLIPKERARIADAIGDVIGNNLMNEDVLSRYLLSDDMAGKVERGVKDFFDKQKENGETLQQLLCHAIGEEELKSIVGNANESLSTRIHSHLSEMTIAEHVAHVAVETVINNLKEGDFSDLADTLGGALRGVGRAFINPLLGGILSLLQEPVEGLLKKSIHDMLVANGKEMVCNLIESQVEGILQRPVNGLISGKEEQIARFAGMVRIIYVSAMKGHLPRILQSVDISRIVRDRINEMDIAETEKLIMQVMRKELKAIVWLGALLGFVMGFVNLLLMRYMG